MKHLFTMFIVIIGIMLFNNMVYACDEQQTNTYVSQILFGYNASRYQSDDGTKMLLNALYLCSEQADGLGQEKIDFLNTKRVIGIPSLKELDINSKYLQDCVHIKWEDIYSGDSKIQSRRKQVLLNTVNTVFDFGFFEELFGRNSEKCNSFSALLYYSHILADYIADKPSNTENNINGNHIPAYSGNSYIELNGNRPSFSEEQKKSTQSFIEYSQLDNLGRAGVAFANIGPEILATVGPRENMSNIRPSGWNFNRYEDLVGIQPPYLYNRCHLLAHSLGGKEQEINLVTCTRYLNESGMSPFEQEVTDYIRNSGNHVLYRVTPHFNGDNKLVSGIQIEAYSIEDSGEGISFNIYEYNVQPGVDINYITGDNYLVDTTLANKTIIPFAVYNPSGSNTDLIFEMSKHLSILFDDQVNSFTYKSLVGEINAVASEARNIVGRDNNAKQYLSMKPLQYKYLEILKTYVPLLLMNEDFYKTAYK